MILDYLQAALGEGTRHDTSKGLQYSFRCPFCNDHKERLFVNLDRQVFWCHNCESTGSMITFISDYAGIEWTEALKVYRDYENYERKLPDNINEEIYAKLMSITPANLAKERFVYPLPEEFILIEEAKGEAGRKAIQYLKSRGITLSMAEKYYIGYCAEGKYANRIIMPDFEQGELVYWQARTWEPAPKNKHLRKYFRKVLNPSPDDGYHIPAGSVTINKSEILGNIDFVLSEGVAVLCEGRMDSYTLSDIGCHMHGKHMSDEQFTKLIMNKDKIQVIYVMLDGDALKNAITTADRLYRYYDEVYICKLPEDKDPNQLGPKGCLKYIQEAIKYDDMFPVKARLKGWI